MIRIRDYSDQDAQHLNACLSHHQDSDPARWTDGGLKIFYDDAGNVLYMKVQSLVRLHILHDPCLPLKASANLILQSGIQIKEVCKIRGYKEILFESTADPLIRFSERRLGFKLLKDNYMAVL